MKTRLQLALPALLLALAACENDPAGPDVQCVPFTNTTASVQGDTVTTITGLRYIETQVGTGRVAEACLGALVHYTLYLPDGTIVDSSLGGGPFPLIPSVSNVIPGFAEGVVGMREGGQRRIIVPPALGYGARGSDRVPPNTTITFDLNLVDVVTP